MFSGPSWFLIRSSVFVNFVIFTYCNIKPVCCLRLCVRFFLSTGRQLANSEPVTCNSNLELPRLKEFNEFDIEYEMTGRAVGE